ncbi:glycoside hydrolase family 95-like protein [Geofilum rubicundum]
MQSHDGALHLLPALPEVWPSGRVTGLRARGGFEIVELEWDQYQVTRLVVKSTLGGNLRLRAANALEANGKDVLEEAKDSNSNSNPFYQVPAVKEAVVSASAQLNHFGRRPSYLYDIETVEGEELVFVAQ